MSAPEIVLLVRFRSSLSMDEIETVMEDRIDQFRALEGLEQKYYLHDPQSGEIAGLYLWESAAALDEYRQSELRATIAAAYEAEGEPQVQVFRVLKQLRD